MGYFHFENSHSIVHVNKIYKRFRLVGRLLTSHDCNHFHCGNRVKFYLELLSFSCSRKQKLWFIFKKYIGLILVWRHKMSLWKSKNLQSRNTKYGQNERKLRYEVPIATETLLSRWLVTSSRLMSRLVISDFESREGQSILPWRLWHSDGIIGYCSWWFKAVALSTWMALSRIESRDMFVLRRWIDCFTLEMAPCTVAALV